MNGKRFFALLLCLVLLLGMIPAASAAGETITVSANINGADVYVDNVLAGVTPLTNYAVTSGSHTVEVKLPGYISAAKTMSGGSFTADLQPELYPAEYADKLKTLTVDNDKLYLEDAVAQAMADGSDTWYVINFAPEITFAGLEATLNIDRRGKLTIDGGGTVAISKTCPECAVNVICADVRLTGLIFDGSNDFSGNRNMLSLRLPEDYIDEAYHMDHIYITGCQFTNVFEVGVATCGDYGRAATGYDMPGTANFHDLVFSGNTFDRVNLFSFAGAGDEDYNVIDGYYICGNTFTDGGIGMLAGDAHTWYVYDGTSEWDSGRPMAFCEYNILRNVLVSGNSITMTENAPQEYTGILGVSCANLGNSHNLTENVEFRHNTSRITGGDKNQFSTVSVSGAGISDSYEDGKGYNLHIGPGMEHTDDNTIRNVYIHDNDFQLGTGREMQVHNVDVNVGGQCGKNNTMENIRIENNKIDARCGVRICNYNGNSDSGLCENNVMHDITFTGNTLTRTGSDYWDVGVLAAGSYISQHGHPTAPMPDYRGSMYNVTVKDNDITNYHYGVMVCGAAGDYASGTDLSHVTVEGNHIVNKNWKEYSLADIGIAVTGSAMQTNCEYSPEPQANQNCTVSDVTVQNNTITAGCGILTAGLLVNSMYKTFPSTGNAAENVTITGNTCAHREPTAPYPRVCPGIVTADVVSDGENLDRSTDAAGQTGSYLAIAGDNRARNITLSNNTCTGFVTGQEILHDLTTLSGSDGWQWAKDGQGKMARRQDNGFTYYAIGDLTLQDPTPDDPAPHDPTPGDPTGQEHTWGDLHWTLDADGLLTITGTGPVNRVNNDTPWQHYTDKVRKVLIGEGITAIGECAFTWYPELTDVTLPDTVTAIGEGAFRDSCKLARINLPGSITAMGAEAFKKCTALTAVTLPDSITALEDCTFQECSALEEITLPDGLTRLGNAVFWGCSSLKSITIPGSAKSIGSDVFDGCSGVTIHTIRNSYAAVWAKNNGYTVVLQDIPATAVTLSKSTLTLEKGKTYTLVPAITPNDCTLTPVWASDNTKVVTVSDTGLVTAVGPGTANVTVTVGSVSATCQVTVPQPGPTGTLGPNVTWSLDMETGKLTISGSGAMDNYRSGSNPLKNYRSVIKTVVIKSGVTSVGDFVFEPCAYLTDITIPDSVTSIGFGAFQYDSNLASITIPNSVTIIDGSAFLHCTGLTSITIPDSVTTIGASAFSGCSGLTSVTIGNGVTTIGDSAFDGCENLTDLTLGNSVATIGSFAFDYCSGLTDITIPASVCSISEFSFWTCYGLRSFTVDSNSAHYSNDSRGVLFDKKKTELLQYPCANTETSYTIPNTVTSIRRDAFSECVNLTDITIPDGVTFIDRDAFAYCTGLTSITIPEGVKRINMDTFRDCTSLTDITIPASVTAIGQYAFDGCTNLTTVYAVVNSFAATWANSKGYHVVLLDIPATAVTLSKSTLTLEKGKTYTLVPAITPSDCTLLPVWASDNTKVVTVSDTGLVTAVGPGTANVTVTVGSVSATCQVTVPRPVAADPDLNGDGLADVQDLQSLYTYLSTGKPEGSLTENKFRAAADCNGDGTVNILDYQALYQEIRK